MCARQAHAIIQAEFMAQFGLAGGQVEYELDNYPYSVTGHGRIDILLNTPMGYEVYEVKPLKQRYIPVDKMNFLFGKQQREGYIDALRSEGERVNPMGNTFNPNKLVKPFVDPNYKYVTYYTFPEEPGMIYYQLTKGKKKKEPVTQPVTQPIKKPEEEYDIATILNPLKGTVKNLTDIGKVYIASALIASQKMTEKAKGVINEWIKPVIKDVKMRATYAILAGGRDTIMEEAGFNGRPLESQLILIKNIAEEYANTDMCIKRMLKQVSNAINDFAKSFCSTPDYSHYNLINGNRKEGLYNSQYNGVNTSIGGTTIFLQMMEELFYMLRFM